MTNRPGEKDSGNKSGESDCKFPNDKKSTSSYLMFVYEEIYGDTLNVLSV